MERVSGTTNPIATTSARPDDLFSTETTGLSDAAPPQLIRLQDGDRFDLRIEPVRKRLDDAELRMLGYNGSIPGPTLHVDQGSEITVEVTNDGDVDATVHWHGLRLENRYDGVPHDTQAPIPVGGTFTYKVQFPDAGFYWYHPHIREDFGLEMGLYGTIIVDPSDPSYWPAVDQHLTLTLDDLLVEDGHVAPFHRSGPNYTAMGRFGNVMLINGENGFSGKAALGEVVRLYLVNTANTRIFNFSLSGARMKLVGGDSGRYEREAFVDEVMLAPSERAVLDVLFDTPGEARLEHRTPDRIYDLGAFSVSGTWTGTASGSFADLRVDRELTGEHQSMQEDLTRPPDKVLAFVSSMPLLYGGDIQTSSYACPMHPEVTDSKPGTCPKCGMQFVPLQTESPKQSGYVCPMHPEVTDSKPGTCPKCGMKLVPVQAETTEPSSSYVCPMHPEVTDSKPGTCPKCGMKLVPSDAAPAEKDEVGSLHEHEVDGLEWEDLMPEINRASDPSNMFWRLIDRESGSENGAINWAFTVGDRVKIRLVNEMESDHPMHHPFHIHGAGRFLVLSRDAEPESNLVWKDTVLVRAGQEVDIMLDVSNPGLWMAHCHIAEHAQSGMMFSFDVARAKE
jgi:FtsP/CotA-like multicopper oxidase with cupredoxin domain